MRRRYVALVFFVGSGFATGIDHVVYPNLPTLLPVWVHAALASFCLAAAIVTFVLAPLQAR